MRDAVIVGAGISGLTTAFWLTRAGLDVTVLEEASSVGGAIRTVSRDGWIFESGPNTVLESNPDTADLIREADLLGERLEAHPEAKKRFLWNGSRLVALPASPPALVTSPLFSLREKLRILAEPLIKARQDETEESVGAFVRRRLGEAVLTKAVAPFVSGVHAGNPERLSVRWALPRLAELERNHGGLLKGALALRREPRKEPSPMITFRDGLQGLPNRLAETLTDLRTGFALRRVEARTEGFAAIGDSSRVEARRVILALPAAAAAETLSGLTRGSSDLFSEIPYAPIVSVALGFRRRDIRHPLDGFGFLAPRDHGLRILGCLFPSSVFLDRAPKDHVALAVFAGGTTDPEVASWDRDRLLAMILSDLERAVGLSGEPVIQNLQRWPRAIPQFELGHGRFVERALEIERDYPGLHFATNFLDGSSVPACIAKATALARHLLV